MGPELESGLSLVAKAIVSAFDALDAIVEFLDLLHLVLEILDGIASLL